MIAFLSQPTPSLQPSGGPSFLTIKQELGRYLGYDRDAAAWSESEAADIQAAVNEGLRLLEVHDWACLKPWGSLTTALKASFSLYHDQSAGATAATVAVVSGSTVTLQITGGANAGTSTITGLSSLSILNVVSAINALNKGWVAAILTGPYELASTIEDLDATSVYGSANTQTLGTGYEFDYDLPAIFGGLMESPVYDVGTNRWAPIQVVGQGMILQRRSDVDASGDPQWCAVMTEGFTQRWPQRWKLMFWPRPSAARVVRYRFQLRLSALSDLHPWPPGTETFYQALTFASRSAAERMFNGAISVEREAFDKYLPSALSKDADGFNAHTLGINRDRSDERRSLTGMSRYPHGARDYVWNHNGIS